MSFQHIRTEMAGGVGSITLNRPPVNILNIEMMEEINRALRYFRDEKGLKVLVFRAEGKAFSAGVDVGEHLGDTVKKMIETFHGMFRLMDELQAPSVAVVNGSALGGGCELALYCDMVLATERSTFGQPEVIVGVFPPIAALIFPRIIGRKKAMELILSGKTVGARDALEMGIEGLCDDAEGGLRRIERIYLDELMRTEDATEGLKSFLEKRKPVWKDK